jgi:hypothetical protein
MQKQPKTVRVRIPVAVNSEGEFLAYADSNMDDVANAAEALGGIYREDMTRVYYVEADVPVPDPEESIPGVVKE